MTFLHHSGKEITEFKCACAKCGSKSVRFKDNVQWHPSEPDLWGSLDLVCQKCGETCSILDFVNDTFGMLDLNKPEKDKEA